MQHPELSTFEIAEHAEPRGSVIWMHGLGATNHDFDPIVPELDASHLRFVFPAAPVRPVTVNGGMKMPAWYDILTLGAPALRENESHVREAGEAIEALIRRENERGIPSEHIVLAGFSQGAAMALHVGLRYPEPLAGLVVLSGYLPIPQYLEAERSLANRDTQVLQCHGTQDPVVPFPLAVLTRDLLQRAGYPVEFHDYPMGHSLCLPEVNTIAAWLRARIP